MINQRYMEKKLQVDDDSEYTFSNDVNRIDFSKIISIENKLK